METDKLKIYIESYGASKNKLNEYKAECDDLNEKIKNIMKERVIDHYESDGYRVKYIPRTTEKLNEDKLLTVAQKYNLDIIEQKPVVNINKLESMLYNNEIPNDVIDKIAECKESKTTYALTITKKKEK